MDADITELVAYARDLARAAEVVSVAGYAIVSKGSLNIKTAARAKAPRGPHIPYYANSINYDVTVRAQEIEGEIGPAKGRRQWGLGNLLEYGGPYNAPHPHLEPALDEEAPRFIKASEELAARLVQ